MGYEMRERKRREKFFADNLDKDISKVSCPRLSSL